MYFFFTKVVQTLIKYWRLHGTRIACFSYDGLGIEFGVSKSEITPKFVLNNLKGTISKQFLLTFFCFSLFKIVDSEYNTDNYKPLKITIGTLTIKNPKITRFVPDHLKTQKCVIRCVRMFLSI